MQKGNTLYRLGNVYLKLKKYNEAEEVFLNAVKFSKSQNIDGGANFGLGEVYKHLGQNPEGNSILRKSSQVQSLESLG